PAKVQAALLEAMEERQITVAGTTHKLPELFLVLATQNPIEQEGTYPLPEAQLDRFIMKVLVDYPTMDEEMAVIDVAASTIEMPVPAPVVDLDTIRHAQQVVNRVYLDEKVKRYIVSLVHATRKPDDFGLKIGPYIRVGASPRASIAMTLLGKARAFLDGRSYVTPHDVKSIAPDVLRHRVAVSYEAEAEGLDAEHFIRQILDEMPVP
ncbi:MAG: MoxR family ATPase, partial [Verrucomicrobiae bacterium]|nr:MoxR family ATPase [Verrucomicrobiae bacterium]